MNVEPLRTDQTSTGHAPTPASDAIYRPLRWSDVVHVRSIDPKCNLKKAALTLAAMHPNSLFGHEVETYIGKTTAGAPARSAAQAIALRRLAVLEDHEVSIDALRDTGLPEELAVDIVRRLLPRPTGWTIFERISSTPNLDAWARSVITREQDVHVAEDVLTLRILQAFGHDVAVPWSFDTTNKWVFFHSVASPNPEGLTKLLDIATLDRPPCYAMREACRKGYQALAYCHYGERGRIWPHWEVHEGSWAIHPDPRNVLLGDNVVSNNGVTCDTERWLRDVTMVGSLEVRGCSPRTGADYESDLSDPENVTCDPRRSRVAPGDLRERLEIVAAQRRAARRAAQRAGLPPPPPPPLQPLPSLQPSGPQPDAGTSSSPADR